MGGSSGRAGFGGEQYEAAILGNGNWSRFAGCVVTPGDGGTRAAGWLGGLFEEISQVIVEAECWCVPLDFP